MDLYHPLKFVASGEDLYGPDIHLSWHSGPVPPRTKWLNQKSGGWSLFLAKRRQPILEQHRGLFIWGASLAGCLPETDFPCPSLGLQRLCQGESGQKEVENSLFTFHWETWTRNQCFRPSLSRFPRQDSLTLQSALKEAVAEIVQSFYKDFHVAFTARKTPSLSGCLQNTDSLRNLAFLPGRARGLFCKGKHMYNCWGNIHV